MSVAPLPACSRTGSRPAPAARARPADHGPGVLVLEVGPPAATRRPVGIVGLVPGSLLCIRRRAMEAIRLVPLRSVRTCRLSWDRIDGGGVPGPHGVADQMARLVSLRPELIVVEGCEAIPGEQDRRLVSRFLRERATGTGCCVVILTTLVSVAGYADIWWETGRHGLRRLI